MPRLAVKLAYDGRAFQGSQRQPGERTVEGDLLVALARIGAVTDAKTARFLAASRTDAGVSACGNVFAFDTAFDPAELASALFAHLEDAWPHAVAHVPDDFHPRAATRRIYRYRLAREDASRARGALDVDALDAALALFEGTHNFAAFARLEADDARPPVRALDVARVEGFEGPFLLLRFEAASFLWNQVRRLVRAATALAGGEVTRDVVARALETGVGPDLGLAAPEPLVLLDVEYARVRFARDARVAARLEQDLEARRGDALRVSGFLGDVLGTRSQRTPIPRARNAPR